MADDSTGVVVAIVGTVAVLIVVFCIVGVWWYLKKRRRHIRRHSHQDNAMKLDEAFNNAAFQNTENPPPYNAPANQQPGARPGLGQAPSPAGRQSPQMATPTGVVSANPSGYSYKASKPQYGGPTPTAAAAAAAGGGANNSGVALHSLVASPQSGKGRQQAPAQGQGQSSSKDSGLASTSIHSNGNSIDDEEVAPYSMFAAGLLTDATSTSARAIMEGGNGPSQRGPASPRQVALNANGPAAKNSLTAPVGKSGQSPPGGPRPAGMSPPQNFIKVEKVKGTEGAAPVAPGGAIPVYAVPVKRPYVDTRPDPYAAAKRATAQRLDERAKRVRQLNSDADTSASPDIDGGASGSMMQQSFEAASSSDLSRASNYDFDDGEQKLPSKKVRFQTPEEPEKPRKRQLSARYRIRGTPAPAQVAAVPAFVDVPRLGRFMINPQAAGAAGGGGVPLVRSNSNERRRGGSGRGAKPPTGRTAAGGGPVPAAGVALNTSADHVTMRQSSTSSLNTSASAANTSMLQQQQQQEVKQPLSSDAQPAKSILRRQGSNGSLNSSREARRRRTASDDINNVINGSQASFARPASMDVEASVVDGGLAPAAAAAKRVASEPEVHVVAEATRGRKPSSKHRPASMEIPSPSSPTMYKPSLESDV